jgi:hypothetical protein
MIFSPAGGASSVHRIAKQTTGEGAPVESNVDIAVAGDFHRRNIFDGSNAVDQFSRNLFRRLLQLLRELKRNRQRQFAELGLPRLFNSHRNSDAVTDREMGGKCLLNRFFESMEHVET